MTLNERGTIFFLQKDLCKDEAGNEKDGYDSNSKDRQLSSTTTYREVLEEQITPIVLYIEEQAKDQNEKHGASKDE